MLAARGLHAAMDLVDHLLGREAARAVRAVERLER